MSILERLRQSTAALMAKTSLPWSEIGNKSIKVDNSVARESQAFVTDIPDSNPITQEKLIASPDPVAGLPPLTKPTLDKLREAAGQVYPFGLQDKIPTAVMRFDCWGGCIHFRHWMDSYLCHQLSGDLDLTDSSFQCPELLPGYLRSVAPTPDIELPWPERCHGCHWLGGIPNSQICVAADEHLEKLKACPGFEIDRPDWTLARGLSQWPG